jgi:hypothetical protein
MIGAIGESADADSAMCEPAPSSIQGRRSSRMRTPRSSLADETAKRTM